MRRGLPLFLTTVAGLVFAISYFIPRAPFSNAESTFGDWVSIVQSFAVWLGVLNLLVVCSERVARRKDHWQYDIIIVVCLISTLIVGFWSGFAGLNAEPAYSFRDPGTAFDWIFTNIFTPLGATMFAILAFYVASASYRAFRARNTEATLLLIASMFVMGGRVPLFDLIFGPLINHVPIFSQFAGWIMQYPVTGGQRAIAIGIALGIVSSSLRVILGIERSHVGGGS